MRAGGRAVDVEIVARAAVAGGNHKRLAVDHESDMADEAFIENFVGSGAVVNATMRLADDSRARSGSGGFGHDCSRAVVKSERAV
jgi:hypothetical protein